MAILVINCNHWIGFHIVNALLDEEYVVDGVANIEIKETLLDFFGRNSDFTLLDEISKIEYDSCIIIGNWKERDKINAKRTFWIMPEQDNQLSKDIQIIPNLLFGEWMPMNEDGFFKEQQFIAFNSEEFQMSSVYIKDFTKVLTHWLRKAELPPLISIHPDRMQKNAVDKMDWIFREPAAKMKKVKEVIKHYRKYQSLYG